MATRSLNVLITANSQGMAKGFAGAIKSSMALKAGAGAAVVAVGALGKAVYDLGGEFDEAYDTIRVGTGATGKRLEGLEKTFRNVFASVPTDMETASTAVTELNKRLGLTGKPLNRLSRQFAELNRMTGEDVKGSIEAVSKAFEDADVPVKQQSKRLDELFRASQASGASITDLTTLMQKFGSPLRGFDMGFSESLAMFAQFEKAGVNIPTMVPGLKIALSGFLEAGKDPAKALAAAFKGVEDGTLSTSETLKIFGKRAGADMIEAVDQGRFHLASFQKQLETGNETIMKAGRETRDTSENMQLLGNKIKVLVAPAAEWLYEAIGKVSKAFATMNFKPLLRDLGLSQDEMKSVGAIARGMGRVFQEVVVPLVKGALGSLKNQLQGFANFIKSIVKIVGGILRGDVGEVVDGFKDLFRTGVDFVKGLFRGLTTPLRLAAKGIDAALTGIFGGTWETIKGIFEDGANLAIGVLNKMIDVLQSIPFVGDNISNISPLGGGSGSRGGLGKKRGANTYGKQRGGPINLGAPTGDSVPAMLERGEYVLNRNAVRAVGTSTLDAINYGAAPRFQEGGPVQYLSLGSIVKDVAGYTPPGLLYKGAKAAWTKGFPAVSSAVSGIAGLGGKFPSWMDGGYFVDAAIDWLKGKTGAERKKQASHGAGGNVKLGGFGGSLGAAMALAQSMGLTITSTTGGTHVPGSYHYMGRAFDASNGTNTPQERAYTIAAASKWGSSITELFYDPLGWYIKNGQKISGSIGGHSDHVHTAFQGGGVVGTIGSILLRNGLDREAAAGIIGNAYGESSWNPSSMEPGTHNGGLWGFTASPVSLSDLEAYAASQGKPWTSAAIQTQFMLHNLSSSQRSALNSLDSVADTTEWFMANWERPASMASLPTRISAGQKALKMLGGLKAGKSGSGGSSAPKSIPAKGDGKTGGMQAPSNAAKGPNTEPRRVRPTAPRVPKILQGVGMKGIEEIFRSPGINPFKASELALELAEDTPQTWDDTQVMKFQLNYSKKRKQAVQKEIKQINKKLGGRLTDKQRQRLMAKREGLYGQLGTQNERIGTAREGLRGEPLEGTEAGEDPALKAQEENTAAVQAHTEAIKGLEAQMKEQTDFAKSAVAESAVSGMMAVADMLSGMLGGSVQQAQALAGAGSIGSVGRF